MRIALVLAVVLLVGCGSSSGPATPEGRLTGTWVEAMTNGTALGITFDGNGNYLGQQVNEVSATSFQDQAESGLAVITATSVTLTPQKWTCDGPDSVETDNYVLTGNSLTLSGPAGFIVLERDTSPTTSTAVISFGCFTATGFVAHALLPVTNQ